MNDERKTTIEVNMTDDEWIELLCLCEDINLTPEDLAVAFCQEVIRQQALLRIIAAAIRSDMACTGNTLAKLANGITDDPVTLAVKSHLRNRKPVVLAVSTNDALSGSAKNIGILLNTRNYYFVPMSQDDPVKKPTSLVAHFEKIPDTLRLALEGIQIQPLFS